MARMHRLTIHQKCQLSSNLVSIEMNIVSPLMAILQCFHSNDWEKMAHGLMDSSSTVIMHSLIDAKQLSYKSTCPTV